MACVVFALQGSAAGEIYQWVDAQGGVHFQDHPPTASEISGETDVQVMKSSPPRDDSPAAAEETRAPSSPSPPAASRMAQPPSPAPYKAVPPADIPEKKAPKVELYTTSWCPYCAKARSYLRSKGIDFIDYDIEKDDEAARRRERLHRRPGVPLAVINGSIILGFSPSAYGKALAR